MSTLVTGHVAHPKLLSQDDPILQGVYILPDWAGMSKLLWHDGRDGLVALTYDSFNLDKQSKEDIEETLYLSFRVMADLKDTIIFYIRKTQDNLYNDRVSLDNALLLWKNLIYAQRRFTLWHLPEKQGEKNTFDLYNPMQLHMAIWEALFVPLWECPPDSAQESKLQKKILWFLQALVGCHPCRAFYCDHFSWRCHRSCLEPCCKDRCWDKKTPCTQKNCAKGATDPALLAGLAKCLCLQCGTGSAAEKATKLSKAKNMMSKFFEERPPGKDSLASLCCAWFFLSAFICSGFEEVGTPLAKELIQGTFNSIRQIKQMHEIMKANSTKRPSFEVGIETIRSFTAGLQYAGKLMDEDPSSWEKAIRAVEKNMSGIRRYLTSGQENNFDSMKTIFKVVGGRE